MLDPQGDFFAEGEAKVMLEDIPVEIQESLNLKWFQGQDPSPGTVIRLSLRGEHHRREISTKTISCQEVRDHFQSFIQTEMDICLLFLSSLQSIEFWVIEEGETTPSRVALASITPASTASPNNKRRVETTLHPDSSNGKDWLIRWHSVPNSESQDQLSAMIGCDAKPTMEKEKLTATVALAIQTLPEGYNALGKLFTYLPLPSDTNYPCNIHAPFALTVDRQGLRNENEEGFVKGSDDQYVFSIRDVM
jgi:sacsin